MTQQITLTLPNHLFERAERYAIQVQRPVAEVLVQSLRIPETEKRIDPNKAKIREMEAYQVLHPELWEKYPHQHVAIFQGELIDRDIDFDELWDRVEDTYPDEFVWVTTVREQPIRGVQMPSIRIVP